MLTPPLDNQKKESRIPDPHQLKNKLKDLLYTQHRLRRILESELVPKKIHQSQLSLWLNGWETMPDDVEKILNRLAEAKKN